MSLKFCLCTFVVLYSASFSNAQEKKGLTATEKKRGLLPGAAADRDLIDIAKKTIHMKAPEKPRSKKMVNFSFIPISTSTSGGSKVLVSSINLAFTAGDPDSTKVSSIYFLPYTNFYNNIGFGTKVNIWTPNDNWNIPGEFRVSSLVQNTYGLGSHTSTSDRIQLDFKNVRFYVTGNRKFTSDFFAGLGIQYDRYYKLSPQNPDTSPTYFSDYKIGTGRSTFSTGLTFNLLHDSRKNSINVTKGLYYALIYRFNPTFLGNDTHWTSLYLDARKYFQIPSEKRKIIAVWSYYWGAYGDVPYLNLPGTSLESSGRSGRGWSTGRFRGKEMLYLETEYRFDISKDKFFGAVLFVNAQSYKEPTTQQFQYVNPAAGGGIRLKFNKQSDTNLTLDVAFAKDSWKFYIGLGEFF